MEPPTSKGSIPTISLGKNPYGLRKVMSAASLTVRTYIAAQSRVEIKMDDKDGVDDAKIIYI